ncbi:MAG TPA: hypothetical protein VIK61_12555 [Acidimicrobiia bacterium]
MTPAHELTFGERVEIGLWVIDYMQPGDIGVTSQTCKAAEERIAVDSDGTVWLISPLVP